MAVSEATKSRLLTVPETAEYLHMSQSFVWKLRKSRVLPCHKVGRSVRFNVADLERYIGSCQEQSSPLSKGASR